MFKKVIDISKFQTDIDWKKVKKSTVDAVVIRLGYRGYSKGTIARDPMFDKHLAGCVSQGIPHSVYFFPCSINDREAAEEADYIIENVKTIDLSLPVFLDSEVAEGAGKGRADKLSKKDRTRYLQIICDRLEQAGIKAGVYASTSWLNNKLDMSILSKYTVWCAQYNTKCTYAGTYSLWQYTSKGRVDGIKGAVDVSKVTGALPDMSDHIYHPVDPDPVDDVKPYYIKGKVYTTKVNLYIRKTPGGVKKKPYELTVSGKMHSYSDPYGDAVLRAGTRVTCLDTVHDGKSVWILIPSGYICAVTSAGTVYIE